MYMIIVVMEIFIFLRNDSSKDAISIKRTEDLLSEFYRTRNNRTTPSAYSYECKECTKIRVKSKRRKNKPELYPDW